VKNNLTHLKKSIKIPKKVLNEEITKYIDFPKLVLGNLGMIEFRTFEEGKMIAIITFVNTATFKSSRIENFYCLFDE
jgi:hypothetical protein